MKRSKSYIIAVWCLTFLLWVGCSPVPGTQTNTSNLQSTSLSWQPIAPGISYSIITVTSNHQEKDLILAKIDPAKANFHIYQNNDYDSAKTIDQIQKETKALIAFNGGFYSEKFKPTGLLIANGQELSPYHEGKLINGIFTISKEHKAALFENSDLSNIQNYLFAIQNGPILINNQGTVAITQDNGKTASRTAIGIDKDGNIIVILLKQSLFNSDNQILLTEFAHLLKENEALKPLGIHSVLNLDGGPSSGIMVQDQYFAEFQKVQNVIWIEKK